MTKFLEIPIVKQIKDWCDQGKNNGPNEVNISTFVREVIPYIAELEKTILELKKEIQELKGFKPEQVKNASENWNAEDYFNK